MTSLSPDEMKLVAKETTLGQKLAIRSKRLLKEILIIPLLVVTVLVGGFLGIVIAAVWTGFITYVTH